MLRLRWGTPFAIGTYGGGSYQDRVRVKCAVGTYLVNAYARRTVGTYGRCPPIELFEFLRLLLVVVPT